MTALLDIDVGVISYLVRGRNEQTPKVDGRIGNAGRFIDLSKEQWAALITPAVTGKIEIPAR